MPHSYLAFDLGAGSGRAILGTLNDQNRLAITVLHRFANTMAPRQGHLRWDTATLFAEMQKGMRICAEKHTAKIESVAVDSWGVDFGLFDSAGSLIEEPVTYRDHRTDAVVESFFKLMSAWELYQRTGIQIMPINTIFQLFSMSRTPNHVLSAAKSLLFVPDIFNYLLSGVMKSEFTFATTSQLYNPLAKAWDGDVLSHAGVVSGIMQEVVAPGTMIGNLVPQVAAACGLNRAPVIAVASHDTGSAVAAMPSTGSEVAYISSGTWSLMGIECDSPIITKESFEANFTNEGGIDGTFRFLKNIMGMWLLEGCRREWTKGANRTYDELCAMAGSATPFGVLIDPDNPDFLNPDNMIEAIDRYCRRAGLQPPQDIGSYVRCIFESLALDYRYTLEKIMALSGREIKTIHIIGGGSRNTILNQFTANATGLPVVTGLVEATAIGNILVQARAHGHVGSTPELREIVRTSFDLTVCNPQPDGDRWEKAYARFLSLKVR